MNDLAVFDQGRFAPCPDPFNLAEYVLSTGADNAIALEIHGDEAEVWRYTDLRNAVFRTAGGLLDLGLKDSDRLLLRGGNDPAFPVLFLAAVAVGVVPVPTSAMLTEPEVRQIVGELRPAMVAFTGGVEPIAGLGVEAIDAQDVANLRSARAVAPVMGPPDRLAYMIYTSGTSGKARAVMHAHRAIWARRMMWDGWYGLRVDDRMLHAGAFNWTYTLGTGLMDPWARGGTAMVYRGPPDREVWGRLVQDHGATIFAASPGVYRQIVEAGASGFDRLRHGLSAGEKMSTAVKTAWQQQTGRAVYEALGMSEISTFVSSSPWQPPLAGSTGRVQNGRRVAVLGEDGPVRHNEPGVLAVARDDPGLMLGYFDQGKETASRFRGDWFLTGDMVVMDQNGYVSYLGRDDDMMNAQGYRVSPVEVETAMLGCAGVLQAAAAQVEVREGVSVIAGFYVADMDLNASLEKICTAALAKFKRPRMFIKIDTLPAGANNKVHRKTLRNWKPPKKDRHDQA